MAQTVEIRTYKEVDSAVFHKTKERFGGLSNMASGFPINLNEVTILSSEALYQACRFPHLPEIQKLIIAQKSPMTAKMVGKPHLEKSREDWDNIRVRIMRWSLRVKLAQNWQTFGELLLSTGDMPIVEKKGRESFWGAKPQENGTLVGTNVLGRLLMELREILKTDPQSLWVVPVPKVSNFLLYGKPISEIKVSNYVELKIKDLELPKKNISYQLSLGAKAV
jgi:type I restriction enzyme, S subunit